MKPGDNYVIEFTTHRFDTGAISDADTLPSAVASLNGTDDPSFILTVTKKATGHYKVTGTIPVYNDSDIVNVTVSATVNGVSNAAVIDNFQINNNTGSGAYSVTVTATLQGIKVSLTDGINVFHATTDNNGEATFSLAEATYTLALVKAGYNYTPTEHNIAENTTITVSMTPIVIPEPNNPLLTTGYCYTYDGQGNIVPNVIVSFRLKTAPTNTNSFKDIVFTATSNSNGLLTVTLLREAKYEAWRQGSKAILFTTTNESTYDIQGLSVE